MPRPRDLQRRAACRYAKEKPYRDWIAEETLTVDALDEPVATTPAEDAEVPAAVRMAKLGYHWDDVDEVVRPMAQQGKAPLASMGIDAPLACLSKKTRSFFDYFYQLFAQVTNPPIDALREHMVTSTTLYLGNHGNLLEDSRTACQLVRLERPLLSEEEFDRICAIDRVALRPAVSVPSTAAMPARARCRLRSSSLQRTLRLRSATA